MQSRQIIMASIVLILFVFVDTASAASCPSKVTIIAGVAYVSGGAWADLACVNQGINDAKRMKYVRGEWIINIPIVKNDPSVTFYMNNTVIKLVNRSYLRFRGAGSISAIQMKGVTIIPWDESKNRISANDGSYFLVSAYDGSTVTGSIIDSNISFLGNSTKYPYYGFYILNGKNFYIMNVTAVNNFHGIFLDRTNDSVINQVKINSSKSHGVFFKNTKNNTFKNVISNWNGLKGFADSGINSNIRIDGGSAGNNKESGYWFKNGTMYTLSNVLSYNAKIDAGIVFNSMTNSLLRDSSIYGNYHSGFFCEDLCDNIIVSNVRVFNNYDAGLFTQNTYSVVNPNRVYFRNNRIYNNKLTGIDWNGCDNCIAENNIIYGNGHSAILTRKVSKNNLIKGNDITNSRDYRTRWDYMTYGTGSNNNTIQDPKNNVFSVKVLDGVTYTVENTDNKMFMFSTPKTFTAQPKRTSVTLAATITEYNITVLNATAVPLSGSVALKIAQWNTKGNFRKVFNVSGSGTVAVNFTIGDNPANKRMKVIKDGVLLNNYLTNAKGYFTFSHSGPWSENKFEITTV